MNCTKFSRDEKGQCVATLSHNLNLFGQGGFFLFFGGGGGGGGGSW